MMAVNNTVNPCVFEPIQVRHGPFEHDPRGLEVVRCSDGGVLSGNYGGSVWTGPLLAVKVNDLTLDFRS